MRVVLAEPRGFCAGVERAIAIVERALEKFGDPVYVRNEIVHNRWVVEALRRQGAVFVRELSEVPAGATVIFSAHGVAKAVVAEGRQRALRVLDATCPLVSKVHREADRLDRAGYRVILIGHPGHPEVDGTLGQLPPGRMTLVSRQTDVADLPEPTPLSTGQPTAYITQTTLSLDETAHIVAALQQRFPDLVGPAREDICYATQNRQNAVKAHWAHFEPLVARNGLDVGLWGVPVVWVWLDREDRLGQAISFARAKQSGEWADFGREGGTVPTYDAVAIRSALEAMELGRQGWERYFADEGISPIAVSYEAFVADREAVVRRIIEAVDPGAVLAATDLGRSTLRRQSDGISAEWRVRFEAEEAGNR